MQQTYQDRLELLPEQMRWLDAFGDLFGRLERKLYRHAAKGENFHEIKSAFCVQHGLTARQYNAMRIELEGKISSTIELLKNCKQDLERNIKKTKRTLAQIEKNIKAQEKLRDKIIHSKNAKVREAGFNCEKFDRYKKRKYQQNLRLTSQENKLASVTKRLEANVPGICFGSRKLFKQQFHLELTDFTKNGQSEERAFRKWQSAWKDARSHQFYLVGSKDETTGNQSCKARLVHAAPSTLPVPEPSITLTIRMPQALIYQGAPKFLDIHNVYFHHGHQNILKALRDGVALTYRFHRDDHTASGWRVFVATDVEEAKITSLSSDFGVLGVDFNADHLAWSHTDRFGNLSTKDKNIGRIALPLKGKTSEQRDAILSEALDQIFTIAKEFSCPVAIEDLDFSVKKRELSKLGVKRARMLSGLAYAQYKTLARSKAARLGAELIIVDPAYTSVMGSVKYAVRLGRTVHQAAAGVIARRAQGLKEKLPRRNADRSITIKAPLMGSVAVLTLPEESSQSTRKAWENIRKNLTRHCAEQLRSRKASSPDILP